MVNSRHDHVSSLEAELANLEFQLEIVGNFELADDCNVEEFFAELRARNAHIASLRRRLERSISSDRSVSEEIDSVEVGTLRRRRYVPHLPYELMSAIFKHASIKPDARANFAMSVSRVSRYWRETAMQIPFLWSGISLPIFAIEGGYQISLKAFIQRSQSYPLDIFIDLQKFSNDYFRNMFSDTRNQLDILVPEASRWRSFTLEGDCPLYVFDIIAPLGDLRASILASFRLSATAGQFDWDDIHDNRTLDLFTGGTPLLSHVHIGGITEFFPPLSSVTYLHLEEFYTPMGGREFLDMLRSSHVLVCLRLDGAIVDGQSLYQLALRNVKVEMGSLRVLSFTAELSDKCYLKSILNTIHCPNLGSMTISARDHFGCMGPAHISSTHTPLVSPYPMLHSLELFGLNCIELAEQFDFTQLPSLATISLIRCTSPMAFLRILLPSQGNNDKNCFWPLLRVIKLTHLGVEEFNGLCEIISHRIACDRPIETVQIDPRSLDTFPEKVEWMKLHLVVQWGEHMHYQERIMDVPFLLPDASSS